MQPNENTRLAGLAAVVFAVIVLLWAADAMLARAEHGEMQSEAHGDWANGMHALGAGQTAAAEDFLRKAYAVDRTNATYGLDLATALTAGGKLDDASALLDDLLKASPNDGPTNLAAARLAVRRGNLDDAKAYYHRAIYGAWPRDARAHRIATRFELADLLDSAGDTTELLAELLPLEPEVQENPEEEKRVAALFLHARSPARAADAYRSLLEGGAKDAATYSGLGEAELALADYSAAESAFRNALRRQPGNATIQARLDLAAQMADLDPTVRRLTSREKYERSARILEAARDSLTRCAPPERIADDKTLEEADQTLKKRTPAYVTNEAAENILGLAGNIWHTRLRDCGTTISPEEEPVDKIISSLSQ